MLNLEEVSLRVVAEVGVFKRTGDDARAQHVVGVRINRPVREHRDRLQFREDLRQRVHGAFTGIRPAVDFV